MHKDSLKINGFTLVEVLITVVILGVLAGLATPSFFNTVEQSRANEAWANLNVIHMGEKIYYLNNNNTYWTGNGLQAASTNLNIDLSAAYYDTLTITSPNATTYVATLTRNTANGGNGAKWCRYTFNNATDTAPVPTSGG